MASRAGWFYADSAWLLLDLVTTAERFCAVSQVSGCFSRPAQFMIAPRVGDTRPSRLGRCCIRTGFIMNIYEDGNKVSLEEILADPTIRRLLNTLLVEVLFFTGGQVAASLRGAKPAGVSVHRFDRRIRYLIDHLVEAEYIGPAAVDRLPPPTIGTEPIFTSAGGCPLPTEAEACAYADASARRIPPLASHTRTKLYFARGKLCPLVRGMGYRLPPGTLLLGVEGERDLSEVPDLYVADVCWMARGVEDQAHATGVLPSTVWLTEPFTPWRRGGTDTRSGRNPLPFKYVPWPGRPDTFQKVLEWHLEVENRSPLSAHELAATHLTAHANLNQLRFFQKYRSAIERGESEFLAHGDLSPGFPHCTIAGFSKYESDLYFLRPCVSHQIGPQLEEYRKKHMNFSQAWWM